MNTEPRIEKNRTVSPITYTVRWELGRSPDGKRKTGREFCGSDYDFAKEMVKVVRARLQKAAVGQVDDERPIRDCMDKFLKDQEDRYSAKRFGIFKTSFRGFLKLPNLQMMSDITEHRILDYQSALRSVRLANATIITYLSCISVWLGWAKERGWIGDNPYPEEMKFDAPRKIDRFFTDQEITDFERVIDNASFLLMFRLGYLAGLRPGEILRVKGSDRYWVEDKGGVWVLRVPPDETKTNSGRTVPLDPGILELWPEVEGLLFHDWTEQRRDRHFEKAKTRAEIKDRIIPAKAKSAPPQIVPKTFYWTRHAFARRQIERGMNMKVLMYVMGHSTFKETSDTYGHLESAYILEHVRSLKASPILGLPRPAIDVIFGGASVLLPDNGGASTVQRGETGGISGDIGTHAETKNGNGNGMNHDGK